MWNIISWALLGLVAGAIAKKLMPGKDPGGLVMTIIIGVAGAMVGGFLVQFLGWGPASGFNLYSIFVAIGGSMLLLWGYRKMKG